jgi:hypothetical protein
MAQGRNRPQSGESELSRVDARSGRRVSSGATSSSPGRGRALRYSGPESGREKHFFRGSCRELLTAGHALRWADAKCARAAATYS